MNLWIKQKTTVEGIKSSNGDDYTISQFADDTSIAIKNKAGNIKKTFDAINNFGQRTGLKLNIEKTEIILLGETQVKDIPKKFRHQIKENIKSLGLVISTDPAKTKRANYEEVIDKMKTVLTTWRNRRTSLAGKINIIKSLVTSKLVYAMSNLPSPEPEYWK